MVKLDDLRIEVYANLESTIGNTSLAKYGGDVPNDNSIFIKRECDNPFGSHYDRVYCALFKDFEMCGKIQPGMNVLETTSGSAGVSFAGIARILGYPSYVMIPEGKQLRMRRNAIAQQGAHIILTPEDEYINGFTKERIIHNIRAYDAVFLNHSMGAHRTNNETTLKSLEPIAEEVLNEISVDVFVAGIGNGSSIVGPGRVFRQHNPDIFIIGYKPFASGKSEAPGLINQDGLNEKIVIQFPHIADARRMMDEEVLFSNNSCSDGLPHWDAELIGTQEYGVSTKAGISVALEHAKRIRKRTILVIAYDKMDRY